MGMERYRAIVKLEDIRTLFENGRYEEAKTAADGLRRERLKDSADLFLLAALYRKCGKYETAKELLLRIYEKKATWRVLEELMEVCLAEKNPKEAGAYLKEYCKISGGDPRNYIYEYRIGRQMHCPDEELLPILQTLKAEEYTEKYGYELAKLYHKLGREQECMAECADLVLWFGEGTYVERAKALQAYYRGELSAEDIRTRSSQKEEERRRLEEEERRRQEEELRRFEEEERRRQEEELYRFEEEERRRQEEELHRFEEEERRAAEEEYRTAEETEHSSGAEAWNQDAYVPAEAKERSLFQGGLSEQGKENLQKALEEMAAADVDGSMGGPVSVWMAGKDVATGEAVYEQISLFPSEEEPEQKRMSVPVNEEPEGAPVQEVMSAPVNKEPGGAPAQEVMSVPATEEPEEEPAWEEPEEALTELSAELSFCLSANGVVFEEALHGYARVERVRKQVIQVLGMLLTAKKRCHCLVITGGKQSGKTTLGTYLVKLLYELSYVNSPRVAKISAAKLNQLRLSEKSGQLRDCCLMIECAGELTGESIAALLDFIGDGVPSAVVLEDNASAMNRLLRAHAECNRMFNNRIHLPEYSRGELMHFAMEYIDSHDYEISREAKRILEQKIDQMVRTGKKERRLTETMETVKVAIENADYRNQGTILTMAAAGNLLAAGAMELAAEDFGVIR